LLPSVPEPADAGAKLRNRGLLRLAAEDHVVDALAFGRPEDGPRLARLVRAGAVVPPPTRRWRRRLWHAASSHLPDMADRLWSMAFRAKLACLLGSRGYEAVQSEGIEMARYLDLARAAGARRVYDAHNAEFLLQRRALAASPNPAAAAYSLLQWRRLERFEGGLVRRSDLTLAVSEHDANQLTALAGTCRPVATVPNGIDLAAYPFRAPAATDQANVLLLGTLGYRPQAQAAAWLLGQVLPRLFERRSCARLFVVGAQPPRWLVRAGQRDPRIAVIGPVTDERPYLARCSALVLPHQVGGGSRLKALVAWASGVPIVSARLGMEGLEGEPGTHYLQADEPAAMAEALDRVLGDVTLRRRLARAGRALVEERYDWPRIGPALRAAYASLG
jgi:polysaccharide biosynthesis protein PslH